MTEYFLYKIVPNIRTDTFINQFQVCKPASGTE